MSWKVEGTGRFEAWYLGCSGDAQADIEAAVELLEEYGPSLGRPAVDTVNGSRFPNMKELRVQSNGRPLRILFAFDPRRMAILLIGGDKTGATRFYQKFIPIADRLYAEHLREIEGGDSGEEV